MTGDKAAAAQHDADATTDAAVSMVLGSLVAALKGDTDAHTQRKDNAMPDQAPTRSEQLQKGLWDHFAQ